MNHPFEAPEHLQDDANRLPAQIRRADTLFAGGQNQRMLSPWSKEARSIQPYYGTAPLSSDMEGEYQGGGYFVPSSYNPAGMLIRQDQRQAQGYQRRVDASHQMALGRLKNWREPLSVGRLQHWREPLSVGRLQHWREPLSVGRLRTYSNPVHLGRLRSYSNPVHLGAAQSMDPVVEFNSLLAVASSMVRRLSTGSGAGALTTGTSLPEVQKFQKAWNQSKGLVVDELDRLVQKNTNDEFFQPQKGSYTYNVIVNGLVVDGKYGTGTATALMLVMWASLGEWEGDAGVPKILMRIPANPKYWPQVWANHHDYWSQALAQIDVQEAMPSPAPAPKPPPAQQVITEAEKGDQTPVSPPPEAVMEFEEEPVVAQTKGMGSATKLYLILGGVAVAGGIIFAASRR